MQLKNNINQDFILRNIDQVEIFSLYLGIPTGVIENCIKYNNLCKSPFRSNDTHNSLGFMYYGRKLKAYDFGGYFKGDCFDAACLILNKTKNINMNTSNKEDFKYILLDIASRFNQLNGTNPIKMSDISVGRNRIKREPVNIQCAFRQYGEPCDYKYWINKYHNILTFTDLYNENIFPVNDVWINSEIRPNPVYTFNPKDPCYAYYEGSNKGTLMYRLYFPARSKDFNTHLPKFITNNQSFQRLHSLRADVLYDKIIIIKSKKDAILLDRILGKISEFLSFTGLRDIAIIAYPSENYIPNKMAITWLTNKLKSKDTSDIISFLDFDMVGRRTSIHTYYEYGINYVFLTNGLCGLVNYKAKDLSDYLEIYGIDETINLIIKYIQWLMK